MEGTGSDLNISSDNLVIQEGSAVLVLSPKAKVFYNPVQEFNRDISIAVLSQLSRDAFSQRKAVKRHAEGDAKETEFNVGFPAVADIPLENGYTILEALSASGLRSIRYAKEVPGLKQIIANDISEAAVETMKKNIDSNGVEKLVTTSHSDASMLMYRLKCEGNLLDAIDLDPYGCPSRFLDSAVQAVKDGGVLLVTCTDMAVLAGNSPETCYIKYGAISLRASSCHEMALRIVLQCIESHANRYGRYIIPLLSFSVDFYIRVIVRVQTSPVSCKSTTSKLSHVYQCVNCRSLDLQPLGCIEKRENKPPKYSLPHLPPVQSCQHCSGALQMGGPIWNAALHDEKFIQRVFDSMELTNLKTQRRIEGLLDTILSELPDTPLYSTVSSLCSVVHCEVIPLTEFRSALLNAGYRVSLSHAAPNSIKTDAPTSFVWDVVRAWVAEHPIAARRLSDPTSTVAKLISNSGAGLPISFNYHPGAKIDGNVLRYQVNPLPNWGPGHRATTNLNEKSVTHKKNKVITKRGGK